MNEIIFKVGLQAAYDALVSAGTVDAGTLYFTSDTKKIYKGNALYTGSTAVVESLPAKGEEGILYVVASTGKASTWNGTTFVGVAATENGTVQNPTYEASTRTITLPIVGGSDLVINLGKDLVVESGVYDADTQAIKLTLTSGDVVEVPVAALVDVYTATGSNTLDLTVENNEITGSVKVSATPGNAITAETDGLYVDISGKVNVLTGATEDTVPVVAADGNLKASAKKFGGATLAEATDANTLATEAAVAAAITASTLVWENF